LLDRPHLEAVTFLGSRCVGEDDIHLLRPDSRLGEREGYRARELPAIWRRVGMVVRIVGRTVPRELSVNLRGAALLGVLEPLDEKYGATFAGDVSIGCRIERSVGGRGIVVGAQQAASHLADERVGTDRCLGPSAHHHVDATSYRSATMLERVESTGTVAER